MTLAQALLFSGLAVNLAGLLAFGFKAARWSGSVDAQLVAINKALERLKEPA